MSKKILVIDDDPTLIKVVQGFLKSNGFDVIVATNGQEGMSLVQQAKPDLIVLDVLMPKMNGYAFIIELKKVIEGKMPPVIVLTVKEEMKDLFGVEGVKDYIPKPFKPETLLQAIKKYV